MLKRHCKKQILFRERIPGCPKISVQNFMFAMLHHTKLQMGAENDKRQN
jgi:hypothetical protein